MIRPIERHVSQLNTDAIFTQQPYTDEIYIYYGRKVKCPAKNCKGPSVVKPSTSKTLYLVLLGAELSSTQGDLGLMSVTVFGKGLPAEDPGTSHSPSMYHQQPKWVKVTLGKSYIISPNQYQDGYPTTHLCGSKYVMS